jgi:hypothetical protein
VVQGELADGLGVDLDEPPEVRVLVAEPLYDLFNIRTFATMLTQLIGQNLPRWSATSAPPSCQACRFRQGPEQDLDAVTRV